LENEVRGVDLVFPGLLVEVGLLLGQAGFGQGVLLGL
jgi:hypothetical protein